MPIANRLVK